MRYVVVARLKRSHHVIRNEFGLYRAAIMHKLWLERQGYIVEMHAA